MVTKTRHSRSVPCVDCMHSPIVAEPQLPSVQLAAVTHIACCGHTGQGLFPMLLRGLCLTTISLLMGKLSTFNHSATPAGIPKGSVARTVGMLTYSLTSPLPQSSSHFGMTPFLVQAACRCGRT